MKKVILIFMCGCLLSILFSSFYVPLNTGGNVFKKTKKEYHAFIQNITLTGLETKPYIAPKAPGSGGDNDFYGHGPVVHVHVQIYVKDKCLLCAKVTLDAMENGGDGSHALGTKEYVLYFAGFGNEITINSPTASSLAYTDDDQSEDYVGKGGRVKATNAHAYWASDLSVAHSDDLVKFCVITGDTNGSEVGSRTSVRVFFNPINLTLKNAPYSLINNFDLNVVGASSCGENTCSASCGAGLLQHYGFNTVTCEQFWAKEKGVGHFVNWVRDNHIANMGIPPNVLRDKLADTKPDVQMRMLTPANYITELRNIIRNQRRPVIALVSWGSRCVEDSYAPADDSYGFSNAILHYIIISGWDDGSVATANQKVWHIIDNGVRKNWSQEYFANAFFWKPENFVVEGVLYSQNVHPGNIVY